MYTIVVMMRHVAVGDCAVPWEAIRDQANTVELTELARSAAKGCDIDFVFSTNPAVLAGFVCL